MIGLMNTRLFRSVMIASCMLIDGVPSHIPHVQSPPHVDPPSQPRSMKVTSDSSSCTSRSAKKKRHRSVVDSGATIHCIRDKSLFTHLDTSKTIRIRVADNRVIESEGVGNCAINLRSSDGHTHTIVLHNCVYSPHFSDNLISTRRLWRDNRISTHMGATSYFKCSNSKARYYFANDCTHNLEPAARRVRTHTDLNLIHARFNHCGAHRLRKLFDVTQGLGDAPKHSHTHDLDNYNCGRECPACIEGAHRRKSFAKRKSNHYTYFGERISSDLCGPFPKSVDGFTYALCFVDAYSNYCALYLLKSKSSEEVKRAFEEFMSDHKSHCHMVGRSHGILITEVSSCRMILMSFVVSSQWRDHSQSRTHRPKTLKPSACGGYY